MRTFTLDEAFELAPTIVALGDRIVDVRARLTVQRAASEEGSLAELKAFEAQLADLLDQVLALDVQLKGWAPVLVDIPVVVDGRVVLLCLLEGDREIGWFHEVDHGFPGRRPLAQLGL